MSNDALNILPGPQCTHFRSKGMYVTGQLDPADGLVEGIGDGYCWCSQTQQLRGPDDEFVDRQRCNSGRTCYQAVL